MCIAVFSTAHPEYALILANNRDEYLNRPTLPAAWWDPPNSFVLGGRDLHRLDRGTWLGITKRGCLAVLTNFREDSVSTADARSRGAMVNAFLTQEPGEEKNTSDFVRDLVENEGGLAGVGGFSLVCGKIGEALAVVSNRTPNVEEVPWIVDSRNETVGLSNALISDRTWPKVTQGERLLDQVIQRDVEHPSSKSALIENLFGILSDDQLPKRPVGGKEADWSSFVKELRKSIFIPTIGGQPVNKMQAQDLATAESQATIMHENVQKGDAMSGEYGTHKQTIVLVDHKGHVTFVERTLFDQAARPVSKEERDRCFEFEIEGWKT